MGCRHCCGFAAICGCTTCDGYFLMLNPASTGSVTPVMYRPD
jgi:hypothetical protein